MNARYCPWRSVNLVSEFITALLRYSRFDHCSPSNNLLSGARDAASTPHHYTQTTHADSRPLELKLALILPPIRAREGFVRTLLRWSRSKRWCPVMCASSSAFETAR